MIVRVIRERSINATTLGVVMLDDRFFGFSCEDELRERSGVPVSAWKVAGETAIPAGRYRLALTHSARFGRILPDVIGVPGFDGIRIHSGNGKSDTEGCLLFGEQRDDAHQKVLLSRVACDRFQSALAGALSRGEPCWLSVENPLSYGS